jgi:predicted nuclease of predicted toxin-antitoxin system
MKFLVDMPLSPATAAWLRGQGHDAVHVGDIGLHDAEDAIILRRAQDEQRIVVTADLDYPRLLALSRAEGPGLILFRGGDYSEAEVVEGLSRVLRSVTAEEASESILVIERTRIRRRRLRIV